METILHTQIKEEIKTAMRAKDIIRLETLRSLLAMFTNEAVATGKTPQDLLTDDEAVSVIKRAIKQRKESIEQFTKGGRTDLADKEAKEIEVLTPFLPEMMSEEEIKNIAEILKEEHHIEDKSKMGVLIGLTMKQSGGRADGGDVKRVVEGLFA